MIKKVIGIILLTCGIGLALYVIYVRVTDTQPELSPIPNNDNVRIIILSPGVTQKAQ
ncbi:MAG: hypothetical protein WC775_03945 [Patescibacteria group bacterium]